MKQLMIVTDDGKIEELAYAPYRDGVANAYYQVSFGDNGLSREDALRMCLEAHRQQQSEKAHYED